MKQCRITVMRVARYDDLIAQYENPIQHACDMTEGQVFLANGWEKAGRLLPERLGHVVPLCSGPLPRGGGFLRWVDEEQALCYALLQRWIPPGDLPGGGAGGGGMTMFQDGRSQKVAFLAHCLLNQNAISDGTAVRPAGFPEMVSYLLEHGVGIVQLPLPGTPVPRPGPGDPQGRERPVVVENTRIRRAMAQAEPSRRLAQLVEDTMARLLEYRRYGFQVVGILGANRSPLCAVWTPPPKTTRRSRVWGVFLEALSRRLEEVGWQIPMVGFRGTDDAVETVRRLLERAEHAKHGRRRPDEARLASLPACSFSCWCWPVAPAGRMTLQQT